MDKMSEEVGMTKRARRRFTAEQKAQAVRLVRETGSVSLGARAKSRSTYLASEPWLARAADLQACHDLMLGNLIRQPRWWMAVWTRAE